MKILTGTRRIANMYRTTQSCRTFVRVYKWIRLYQSELYENCFLKIIFRFEFVLLLRIIPLDYKFTIR